MINLYDFAVEKIYEIVAGPKDRKPSELCFRCFYCGDSRKSKFKKRGHIYRGADNAISYYCFNCGKSSRGYQFIADLMGVPVKEVVKEVLQEYKDMSGKSLIEHVLKTEPQNPVSAKIDVPESNDDNIVNLKNTWIDIARNEDAMEIIVSRKLHKAPFIPDNWNLYYDTESKRIVIPWYRNRKLVYYQMRKVYGNSDRKYLFPMKTEIPNKDIYGLDYLDDNCPYIFYTEGVFDAIFIKNCIAVGGLTFTSYQERLLEPYLFDKQIVLFPDNPWLDNASRDNIMQLADDNPNALVYMWTRDYKSKDINDLVIKENDFNMFAKLENFQDRILPAMKCKMMLKFGKDNL